MHGRQSMRWMLGVLEMTIEKMANQTLYAETVQVMEHIDKKPSDISRIGSYDGEYECTWDEFKELADFHYDSGFGGVEVATDLIILFRDGTWLERDEYDGSEWWVHRVPPEPMSLFKLDYKQIKKLQGHGSIEHLDEEYEER